MTQQLTSQLLVFAAPGFDGADVAAALGRRDTELSLLTDEKSIKIDAIRRLQSDLATQQARNRIKYVVLYPADRITPPAQHALLKLLEEPPTNVQIILATHAPSRLLPTILSRVQSRHVNHTRQGDSFVDQQSAATHTIWESIQNLSSWKQAVELTQSLPSDREETRQQLSQELQNVETTSKSSTFYKQRVVETLAGLDANVAPTLCWEYLVLGSWQHKA